MTERYEFKPRLPGHLANDRLDHDGPLFDYIVELHDLLWRVTKVVRPGASGRLTKEFPKALQQLEEDPPADLRGCAEELADLMEDVVTGNYTPDSFTTQPIRAALKDQQPAEVLDKPICELESYLGMKLGATYRLVADPECATCVDHAKHWEKA